VPEGERDSPVPSDTDIALLIKPVVRREPTAPSHPIARPFALRKPWAVIWVRLLANSRSGIKSIHGLAASQPTWNSVATATLLLIEPASAL